ncbi:MAG: polysaccharide deacetylase family protein [Magnetococcales bacterium]|nr:polysaccharide deacetylase family protein [Magnetococcales bacterium]
MNAPPAFARRMAGLVILFCCLLPLSPVHGKTGDTGTAPAKYDTPSFTPHFLYPGGEVVLSVDALNLPEERVMAITFDDGPDEKDLEISALMRKHDIPATFFYIGNKIKAHPEVVKTVHANQHAIGYHSFRHQRLSGFSSAGLAEEMRQGKEALSALGVQPALFRPPYGDFNERVVHAAKDQGMETVLWTIDSRDWTGVSPANMAKNVIRQFHPGAVLLFHSQHAATLQALPTILEAAARENFRFVSLGDWRQIVLAANCRASGKGSCPSAPVVAAAQPAPKEKSPPPPAPATPEPPRETTATLPVVTPIPELEPPSATEKKASPPQEEIPVLTVADTPPQESRPAPKPAIRAEELPAPPTRPARTEKIAKAEETPIKLKLDGRPRQTAPGNITPVEPASTPPREGVTDLAKVETLPKTVSELPPAPLPLPASTPPAVVESLVPVLVPISTEEADRLLSHAPPADPGVDPLPTAIARPADELVQVVPVASEL